MLNEDKSVVDVKDRLWAMLNGAEDTMSYLVAAEMVLTTIKLTQGFWVELEYCYKAVEIANAINSVCRQYLDHCHHSSTINRILVLRQDAVEVREHFHRLQQAQFAK